MDGVGEAVRGERLVRCLKRLLQADRPAQSASADLEEDLIGDVVVRVAKHLGEDLREGARLSVNIERLQSLGHGSDRDFAFHAAAGPPDEGCDQLAGVLQADRGILAKTDAAFSVGGPFARNRAIASGVIGVCSSAERTSSPLRSA